MLQVTLVLHGISGEEAAREGKFYFLKLNCTSGSGGAMVQVHTHLTQCINQMVLESQLLPKIVNFSMSKQ